MNVICTLKEKRLIEIADYQQKYKAVLDKQSEDQKQTKPKKRTTKRTANAMKHVSETAAEKKIIPKC